MSLQVPVKGFDASVSITTAKRREQEAITENLHAKTFGGWVNHQLHHGGYATIGNLIEDLKDGIGLVHLLEVIYGQKSDKKINTNPTTEIHRIENVAIAIEMLKNHDPSVQINSKDITDGNRKLTLGLIWRLIQGHQMLKPEDASKSVTQRNKQAKGNLVEFAKKQTAGYEGVEITDLVESFYDGLAFCAIVDKMQPGLLNWDEVRKVDPKARLEKAFQVAEQAFGIPKLLDPEDMIREDHGLRPDEKCLMTYISEFPLAAMKIREDTSKQKEKNLEGELEKERERSKEREAQRLKEKESEEEIKKQKESEAARLKTETDKLKAQHEEVTKAAHSRKEDLKTQNEIINEDNKRLMEDIVKIKEEILKLQKDLDATKNRMIGKLNVSLKEARNLAVMNIGGKSDPYCKLKFESQELKTKVKKKTLNPKWDVDYEFFATDKHSELEVSIWNWDRFTADELIGKFVIRIQDLKDGSTEDKWFQLMDENLEDKAQGEVHLKVSFKLGK